MAIRKCPECGVVGDIEFPECAVCRILSRLEDLLRVIRR